MAQKTPTYLRFAGDSTSRYFNTASGVIANDPDTFLFTVFVRLLEWPAGYAPICQQGTNTGPAATWGLFWYNNNFAEPTAVSWPSIKRGPQSETGSDLCLGIQWSTSAGGVIEEIVSVTNTTGVPAKLGNIYQIQLALREDPSLTRVAVFVDGVSVHQNSQSGAIAPNATAGEFFRVGYPSIAGFYGARTAYTNEERAPMDIIQWMYENDRTLTKSGTNIDPPDGALDPWEELVVDGSATGLASTLNEGTGNPASYAGVNASWADDTKVDPQINEVSNTMAWTFENVQGYSEGELDAYPQPVFVPVGSRSDPTAGELRLRLKPSVWSEHGQLALDAQWNLASGLTSSSAQIGIDAASALMSSASAVNSDAPVSQIDFGGASATGQGRWFRLWMYDKGGTDSTQINRCQITGGNANWVGILGSTSTANYSTRVGTLGPVDSGVARSVGWHEFVMYITEGVAGANETCEIWLDGTSIRTENAADCGASNSNISTRVRTPSAATETHFDWWHWNRQDTNTPAEFQGLVASTAAIVLPAATISGTVDSYDSVTIVDEDAGTSSMEVGTLTYEFRHNGGSWTALNDTNLQAVTPVGTSGGDTLEIRVTLDSGMNDCASPAVRSITVDYTPGAGIIPQITHHRMQLAGSC